MASKGVFMGRTGAIHPMPPGGIINLVDFHLFHDVSEGLGYLGQMDYFVCIVNTEKSKIAGQNYPAVLRRVERIIKDITSAPIDFRYCAHAPGKTCDCRMPKPGLLHWFAAEYDLDLASSIMIASHDREVGAALRAGIPKDNIMRLSRGRTEWGATARKFPIYDSLAEAVAKVVKLEAVNV